MHTYVESDSPSHVVVDKAALRCAVRLECNTVGDALSLAVTFVAIRLEPDCPADGPV